jgi:hypothetical protein
LLIGEIKQVETGIFIRAFVNDRYGSFDIGDKALTDKQVLDWMRGKGNNCAERVAMLLLGRDQDSVKDGE